MARRVAFCGVDGAGKTSLVARVRELTFSSYPELRVQCLRNDVKTCRTALARQIDFESPAAYLDGPSSTLYALASAFDFCFHAQTLDASDAADLVLMDRWVDCYRAFAGTVSPDCDALLEALFGRIPAADLTVFVRVPPRVAWQRILTRPDPVTDESLALLERFDRAYRRVFSGRKDVYNIDNSGRLDDAAAAVVGELNDRGLLFRSEAYGPRKQIPHLSSGSSHA